MLLSVERPLVGAFAFLIPGATRLHRNGLLQPSCRRRLNMREWTIEIPQELARSCRLLSEIPGRRYRANQLQALAGHSPPRSEESECELRYRQAKVTKRGGMDGRKS
jgi:hypothetical protein